MDDRQTEGWEVGRPALAPQPTFDDLFGREYPKVVRLAFALTGRRDVAEEEAQEAMLAAYRNWARLATYEDPSAWLRRVVVNRCTSVARRKMTEARLLVRLGAVRVEDPDLPEADDALWEAVRALPRRQRQVVALRFVEDRSVAQIAQIIGCDEPTVRTHLRRGRLAVAAALGVEENENS